MEDREIVELYWSRSEQAIDETDRKYGSYCRSIAQNILRSREDTEESVSDAYLGAWNSMPPHRPGVLSTFLGKLTRRSSIDRLRSRIAVKRGGGELPLVLEELSECLAAEETVEATVEQRELTAQLNRFLKQLPEAQRQVFVCRYWYLDSVGTIAKRFGWSESKVKSMLFRTRKKLREQLEKEGLI